MAMHGPSICLSYYFQDSSKYDGNGNPLNMGFTRLKSCMSRDTTWEMLQSEVQPI